MGGGCSTEETEEGAWILTEEMERREGGREGGREEGREGGREEGREGEKKRRKGGKGGKRRMERHLM